MQFTNYDVDLIDWNLPAVVYVVSVGNIQVDCFALLQVGILTAFQPEGYKYIISRIRVILII